MALGGIGPAAEEVAALPLIERLADIHRDTVAKVAMTALVRTGGRTATAILKDLLANKGTRPEQWRTSERIGIREHPGVSISQSSGRSRPAMREQSRWCAPPWAMANLRSAARPPGLWGASAPRRGRFCRRWSWRWRTTNNQCERQQHEALPPGTSRLGDLSGDPAVAPAVRRTPRPPRPRPRPSRR